MTMSSLNMAPPAPIKIGDRVRVLPSYGAWQGASGVVFKCTSGVCSFLLEEAQKSSPSATGLHPAGTQLRFAPHFLEVITSASLTDQELADEWRKTQERLQELRTEIVERGFTPQYRPKTADSPEDWRPLAPTVKPGTNIYRIFKAETVTTETIL